jgi:hypothetical protein
VEVPEVAARRHLDDILGDPAPLLSPSSSSSQARMASINNRGSAAFMTSPPR